MTWSPCLIRAVDRNDRPLLRLGHEQVDRYLEFLAARARANTVWAAGYDLKVFFSVVAKDPVEVTTADVLAFITEQRGDRSVVRLGDGESGLSPRTIQRRLSSISGLFAFLVACGELDDNPVPRGLSNRRRSRTERGTPLIRTPRTLPMILEPDKVTALLEACRKWRDRAMVEAMVLGGLRRSEVLGLRFRDLKFGDRRVFIVDGKGGHQRLVPISKRFFDSVANYLDTERPEHADPERVFVVLKGPNTGRPLSAKGLDQIVLSARERAGLEHCTCHELRHTCLTRLREAGMSLEAVQAQAGHRSIESTRIYLHLSNDWLADEYLRASEAIDARRFATDVFALGADS
ncbi:MAG: tyrosine-type recombinase/integrase [Acidimicrobiia bacterium]